MVAFGVFSATVKEYSVGELRVAWGQRNGERRDYLMGVIGGLSQIPVDGGGSLLDRLLGADDVDTVLITPAAVWHKGREFAVPVHQYPCSK